MSKPNSSPVGVGVITILTVLLVLCLTIFASLTLTSARADLALSQRNAETVRAYYRADAEAVELYRAFAAGTEDELDTAIPMTGAQSLHLHLVRAADGGVEVRAWQTVSQEEALPDDHLPVWDGSLPGQ